MSAPFSYYGSSETWNRRPNTETVTRTWKGTLEAGLTSGRTGGMYCEFRHGVPKAGMPPAPRRLTFFCSYVREKVTRSLRQDLSPPRPRTVMLKSLRSQNCFF